MNDCVIKRCICEGRCCTREKLVVTRGCGNIAALLNIIILNVEAGLVKLSEIICVKHDCLVSADCYVVREGVCIVRVCLCKLVLCSIYCIICTGSIFCVELSVIREKYSRALTAHLHGERAPVRV